MADISLFLIVMSFYLAYDGATGKRVTRSELFGKLFLPSFVSGDSKNNKAPSASSEFDRSAVI